MGYIDGERVGDSIAQYIESLQASNTHLQSEVGRVESIRAQLEIETFKLGDENTQLKAALEEIVKRQVPAGGESVIAREALKEAGDVDKR